MTRRRIQNNASEQLTRTLKELTTLNVRERAALVRAAWDAGIVFRTIDGRYGVVSRSGHVDLLTSTP